MEDLVNEFSSYAIEDIGQSIGSSAPCGLMQKPSPKKQPSSDALDEQSSNCKKYSPPLFPSYKSKLNYSVNLNSNLPDSIIPASQITSKGAPKTRHRYSTRSSSIVLKSNSLALSDSESTLSDDTKGNSFFNERKQPRNKKSKRKKPEKEQQQQSLIYRSYIPISDNNNDQYYGKRKRSTTITQNTYESTGSQMSSYTANKLKKNEYGLSMQCDFNDKNSKLGKFSGLPPQQNDHKMELDEDQEDSTSLSEESSLSDPRFLEADDEQSDYYEVSNFQRKNNNQRQYGRTSLDKTSNPFSILSSTPTTSSVLWKRRRRNLPNNHFN